MVIWVTTVVYIIFFLAPGFTGAQEKLETPSQKTKEAVDKLLRAPSAVGKSLQDLGNAAKAKLEDAVAETKSTQANADGSTPAEQKSDPQSPGSFSTTAKRDPF